MSALPDPPTPEPLIDGVMLDLEEHKVAPGAKGVERRRYQRVETTRTVKVTEFQDSRPASQTWECRLVDISRGGEGLRSRRMVHVGRSLLIEVPAKGGPTRVLYGVVRQSRYAEGEGNAIGLEFTATPQDHAFLKWLSKRGLRP
jgi:hypothetical protein